jgi:hypothetical protein
MGVQAGLDGAALGLAHVADLQQAVDEQAQARVGRQAAGAGVGGAQQAGLRQVLHGVADRGRRQGQAALGQGARSHRLAGVQIALDDAPEDLARPAVELGKRGAGGEER